MDNYRIIVVSDTHQIYSSLNNIICRHKDEATCFIHLGDCCREIDEIRADYPDITLHNVRGNGDFDPQIPTVGEIVIGGKRIVFTHGHLYQVSSDLDPLKTLARNLNADIVLYGHTHIGHSEYDQGLYIMNPGSPILPRDGNASYGIIDITKAGVFLNLVSC